MYKRKYLDCRLQPSHPHRHLQGFSLNTKHDGLDNKRFNGNLETSFTDAMLVPGLPKIPSEMHKAYNL